MPRGLATSRSMGPHDVGDRTLPSGSESGLGPGSRTAAGRLGLVGSEGRASMCGSCVRASVPGVAALLLQVPPGLIFISQRIIQLI